MERHPIRRISLSGRSANVPWLARLPRLLIGAAIGAIACSLVPLLPTFLPLIGAEKTAESGGLQTLIYVVWMTGENIFYGPWGLIGCLAGASLSWLGLRARQRSKASSTAGC